MALIHEFAKNESALRQDNFMKVQTALNSAASLSVISEKKFLAVETILSRQEHKLEILGQSRRLADAMLSTISAIYIPSIIALLKLQESLLFLKHEKLTFEILPLAHAVTIYRQIQDHIDQTTKLFLTDTGVMSLYQNTDLGYYRTDNNLHVALSIKLSYFEHPLHLYQADILTLNFPNQQHSTRLGQLPKFLAINQEDQYFLTMDEFPILTQELGSQSK